MIFKNSEEYNKTIEYFVKKIGNSVLWNENSPWNTWGNI